MTAAGLVAILAVAAIWFAGTVAGQRALRGVVSEGRASAALHSALLRSELQKYRLVPFALADDRQVRAALTTTGDTAIITELDKRLERLNDSIHAAAIYLIDTGGKTLAASNWEQPLSFVGSNYGFRAYFREALRKGAFEQFALGTVSRVPGLYIARRVNADRTRGVVVLKVEFDQLEAEWAQSGNPAYVTDSNGIVLITSVPQWRFLAERRISDAERAAFRRNLDFGDAQFAPLPIRRGDQAGLVTVTDPSVAGDYVETIVPANTPGWRLHVLTPVGTVARDASNMARLVTAVLLLLIGLTVAEIARRRRRRRMETQRAAADRAALEAEVSARTLALREANRQLTQEMADRRASEAQLQHARDQLVQANKLASLGQITAGVAHEINQPVAAIRSYADNGRLLIDHARLEEAAGNLDRIVAMTERIGAITGELRGFARKARGTLAPVVIGDAIDGALLLLRDRIERQQVAVTRIGEMQAVARGERVRLEQVLMNLLVNALDAMEQGGGGRITITVRHTDARVEVDIQDDGPGLNEEAANGLFRPFTTTKDQGLGLGLIISRDIMRDLGGDLAHVATPGGACFRLWLEAA